MVAPTEMIAVATSLPEDLWKLFDEERTAEDRNVAQHLRVIVRRYFELSKDMATPVPAPAPRPPAMPPFRGPFVGTVPPGTTQTWPHSSITVGPDADPHRQSD